MQSLMAQVALETTTEFFKLSLGRMKAIPFLRIQI